MSVSQQIVDRNSEDVKKACESEMIDVSKKHEKAEFIIDTTFEKSSDLATNKNDIISLVSEK